MYKTRMEGKKEKECLQGNGNEEVMSESLFAEA